MKYKNHIIVLLSGIILIFFFFYVVVPCIIMPWMGLPPERIPTNTVFASEEYQLYINLNDTELDAPDGRTYIKGEEKNIYIASLGSSSTLLFYDYNYNKAIQGNEGELLFEAKYRYHPEKQELILKVGIPNPWGESYRKIVLIPSER